MARISLPGGRRKAWDSFEGHIRVHLIGHSTTAVTLETYTHVQTRVLRDAAD